ncbi:hypothetical protein H696_03178 [Fonticula alba]|uniref:SEC7 domain-containing protein n=1 Tax=Fonticula alba TaxID=691883 RepID=A0A058Z9M9_FONAL|nr:hypothetical protein H696_03178 [Fonticula alba]KCV70821.1 hypothetical protein H696_03178 [Fonticula alba]|eukprot:XP_009495337.1 hypothetical protein H696_03178 [Fonticula alba]
MSLATIPQISAEWTQVLLGEAASVLSALRTAMATHRDYGTLHVLSQRLEALKADVELHRDYDFMAQRVCVNHCRVCSPAGGPPWPGQPGGLPSWPVCLNGPLTTLLEPFLCCLERGQAPAGVAVSVLGSLERLLTAGLLRAGPTPFFCLASSQAPFALLHQRMQQSSALLAVCGILSRHTLDSEDFLASEAVLLHITQVLRAVCAVSEQTLTEASAGLDTYLQLLHGHWAFGAAHVPLPADVGCLTDAGLSQALVICLSIVTHLRLSEFVRQSAESTLHALVRHMGRRLRFFVLVSSRVGNPCSQAILKDPAASGASPSGRPAPMAGSCACPDDYHFDEVLLATQMDRAFHFGGAGPSGPVTIVPSEPTLPVATAGADAGGGLAAMPGCAGGTPAPESRAAVRSSYQTRDGVTPRDGIVHTSSMAFDFYERPVSTWFADLFDRLLEGEAGARAIAERVRPQARPPGLFCGSLAAVFVLLRYCEAFINPAELHSTDTLRLLGLNMLCALFEAGADALGQLRLLAHARLPQVMKHLFGLLGAAGVGGLGGAGPGGGGVLGVAGGLGGAGPGPSPSGPKSDRAAVLLAMASRCLQLLFHANPRRLRTYRIFFLKSAARRFRDPDCPGDVKLAFLELLRALLVDIPFQAASDPRDTILRPMYPEQALFVNVDCVLGLENVFTTCLQAVSEFASPPAGPGVGRPEDRLKLQLVAESIIQLLLRRLVFRSRSRAGTGAIATSAVDVAAYNRDLFDPLTHAAGLAHFATFDPTSRADPAGGPARSPDGQMVEYLLVHARVQKLWLLHAAGIFHESTHKNALQRLHERGVISSVDDHQEVARLLHLMGFALDKKHLGAFLRHGDNQPILKAFLEQIDFANLRLDHALRRTVEYFHIFGETQVIDRVLQTLSQVYLSQQEPIPGTSDAATAQGVTVHVDGAYILLFSIMMLNTDQHRPDLKQRMTVEAFLSNNRGINNGEDFPKEFLTQIYHDIKNDEIKYPEHWDNSLTDDLNWGLATRAPASEDILRFVDADDLSLLCDANLLMAIGPALVDSLAAIVHRLGSSRAGAGIFDHPALRASTRKNLGAGSAHGGAGPAGSGTSVPVGFHHNHHLTPGPTFVQAGSSRLPPDEPAFWDACYQGYLSAQPGLDEPAAGPSGPELDEDNWQDPASDEDAAAMAADPTTAMATTAGAKSTTVASASPSISATSPSAPEALSPVARVLKLLEDLSDIAAEFENTFLFSRVINHLAIFSSLLPLSVSYLPPPEAPSPPKDVVLVSLSQPLEPISQVMPPLSQVNDEDLLGWLRDRGANRERRLARFGAASDGICRMSAWLLFSQIRKHPSIAIRDLSSFTLALVCMQSLYSPLRALPPGLQATKDIYRLTFNLPAVSTYEATICQRVSAWQTLVSQRNASRAPSSGEFLWSALSFFYSSDTPKASSPAGSRGTSLSGDPDAAADASAAAGAAAGNAATYALYPALPASAGNDRTLSEDANGQLEGAAADKTRRIVATWDLGGLLSQLSQTLVSALRGSGHRSSLDLDDLLAVLRALCAAVRGRLSPCGVLTPARKLAAGPGAGKKSSMGRSQSRSRASSGYLPRLAGETVPGGSGPSSDASSASSSSLALSGAETLPDLPPSQQSTARPGSPRPELQVVVSDVPPATGADSPPAGGAPAPPEMLALPMASIETVEVSTSAEPAASPGAASPTGAGSSSTASSSCSSLAATKALASGPAPGAGLSPAHDDFAPFVSPFDLDLIPEGGAALVDGEPGAPAAASAKVPALDFVLVQQSFDEPAAAFFLEQVYHLVSATAALPDPSTPGQPLIFRTWPVVQQLFVDVLSSGTPDGQPDADADAALEWPAGLVDRVLFCYSVLLEECLLPLAAAHRPHLAPASFATFLEALRARGIAQRFKPLVAASLHRLLSRHRDVLLRPTDSATPAAGLAPCPNIRLPLLELLQAVCDDPLAASHILALLEETLSSQATSAGFFDPTAGPPVSDRHAFHYGNVPDTLSMTIGLLLGISLGSLPMAGTSSGSTTLPAMPPGTLDIQPPGLGERFATPARRSMVALALLSQVHDRLSTIAPLALGFDEIFRRYQLPILSGLSLNSFQTDCLVRREAVTHLESCVLSKSSVQPSLSWRPSSPDPSDEPPAASQPTRAPLSSDVYSACLNKLLFPLVDGLALSSPDAFIDAACSFARTPAGPLKAAWRATARSDGDQLGEQRVRLTKILETFFLKYLAILSWRPDFPDLWQAVLRRFSAYVQQPGAHLALGSMAPGAGGGPSGSAANDHLLDKVPESVKNMILVMNALGVLVPPSPVPGHDAAVLAQLQHPASDGGPGTGTSAAPGQHPCPRPDVWHATWEVIARAFPRLMDSLGPLWSQAEAATAAATATATTMTATMTAARPTSPAPLAANGASMEAPSGSGHAPVAAMAPAQPPVAAPPSAEVASNPGQTLVSAGHVARVSADGPLEQQPQLPQQPPQLQQQQPHLTNAPHLSPKADISQSADLLVAPPPSGPPAAGPPPGMMVALPSNAAINMAQAPGMMPAPAADATAGPQLLPMSAPTMVAPPPPVSAHAPAPVAFMPPVPGNVAPNGVYFPIPMMPPNSSPYPLPVGVPQFVPYLAPAQPAQHPQQLPHAAGVNSMVAPPPLPQAMLGSTGQLPVPPPPPPPASQGQ